MAQIVLGMATSHGPMLSTPPEGWGLRVEADRKNPSHPFRGGTFGFDDLVALRRGENLADEITMEKWQARSRACAEAMTRMAEVYADAAPDVAVIIGNDQHEIFLEDNMPAISVFWGDTVDNVPATEEQKAMMPPGIAVAEPGHRPPVRATHQCLPSLGRHLIECLIGEEFDIAQSNALPDGGNAWSTGIPHAYGFVYRQIMKDDVIPHVPVILNTFYPPNQPSARRCLSLGRAIFRAVASWDDPRRVAIIASGGLSHFVIDESLDRAVLSAMRKGDMESLAAFPEDRFQAGTSEIKNWLPVAAAMTELGLGMEVVGYVPCYRSEAGTGTAHAFALWR